MAFTLTLPGEWSSQGWKVKIRDDERCETPHVTLLRRMLAWRLSLRRREFLDARPDPREVPAALVALVWAERACLRREWNRMYPENPVHSAREPA